VCCVLLRAGAFQNVFSYLWAATGDMSLATAAGNCSVLAMQSETFQYNHADAAGAVTFSTDMSTLRLSCNSDPPNLLNSNFTGDRSCSEWDGNTVGQLQGAFPGYGPGLAFDPALLLFDWAEQHSYVSNSSNKLAMSITVQDQAGTKVTPGEFASLLDCPNMRVKCQSCKNCRNSKALCIVPSDRPAYCASGVCGLCLSAHQVHSLSILTVY